MFDISFTEILVISVVALVVIGPEKLPHVARTLGHLFGRARRFASSVKEEINNEIRLDELKELRASMQESAQSFENSVRKEIDHIKSSADSGYAPIDKESVAHAHSADQPVEQKSTQSLDSVRNPSETENK